MYKRVLQCGNHIRMADKEHGPVAKFCPKSKNDRIHSALENPLTVLGNKMQCSVT